MSEVERAVTPDRFRQRFRDDVAADYEKLRSHFLAALEAVKEQSAQCPHCSRHFKIEVEDWAAANKAAELYMAAGFGRPESESKMTPEEEASQQVRAMSDEELLERRLRWLRERGWTLIPPEEKVAA